MILWELCLFLWRRICSILRRHLFCHLWTHDCYFGTNMLIIWLWILFPVWAEPTPPLAFQRNLPLQQIILCEFNWMMYILGAPQFVLILTQLLESVDLVQQNSVRRRLNFYRFPWTCAIEFNTTHLILFSRAGFGLRALFEMTSWD